MFKIVYAEVIIAFIKKTIFFEWHRQFKDIADKMWI